MKSDRKQLRHEAITQAAYAQLAENGYGGASMLKIAKAAKASNETLYRWYGDKRGLFERMARDNAEETRQALQDAMQEQGDPLDQLAQVAPAFLAMLLGDRAIALNRAAAADPTGELGQAISRGGRDVIQPMLAQVLAQIDTDIPLGQVAEWYISLLIGDQQIKRALGVTPAPSPQDIALRVASATNAMRKLLS